MKAIKAITLLATLLGTMQALRAQEVLQLDSCQHYARNNYPLIQQLELLDQAAAFTIENAGKAYLPQLSVTGIGAYVFGGFPNLGPPTAETDNTKFIGMGQLNQVIWDGGATANKKNITRVAAQTDKAAVEVQLYAVKERVNQLYFGILLVQEQLKQADVQLSLLQRNENRLQLLHNNGLALKTDLSELQAEMLRVDQRKTELMYVKKAYLNMLSLFMGKRIAENAILAAPPVTETANTINRPELALYENQKLLLNAQEQMSRVKLMPKVGLMGAGVLITPSFKLGTQDKSALGLAGLSVSWELGGVYTYGNDKKIRDLNIRKVESQQQSFVRNTQIQSSQTNAETEKYAALESADHKIVTLRTEIRNNYQLMYENGNCSMNDLLVATDKEADAQAGMAMHHIQWLMSLYQNKTINGN